MEVLYYWREETRMEMRLYLDNATTEKIRTSLLSFKSGGGVILRSEFGFKVL